MAFARVWRTLKMGTQLCRCDYVKPVTLLELIFLLESRTMIWTLLPRAKGGSFVMGFKETHSKKLEVTAGSPNLQGRLKSYVVFTIVSHAVPKMLWRPSEDTMKGPSGSLWGAFWGINL